MKRKENDPHQTSMVGHGTQPLIFRGVLEILISSQIIFEIEKNLRSLTHILKVRTPIGKANSLNAPTFQIPPRKETYCKNDMHFQGFSHPGAVRFYPRAVFLCLCWTCQNLPEVGCKNKKPSVGKSPLPSCCWYPRNLQQDRSWTEPRKNLSIYMIARSQLTERGPLGFGPIVMIANIINI